MRQCTLTQCESACLGLNQKRMLSMAGVGFSTLGSAVA